MIYNIQTFCTYGYWPEDLEPKSHKPIIIACDKCEKIRISSKGAYRSLCHKCATLKCHDDDPTLRLRQGNISQESWKDPERHERQSRLVTEQWKNPEIKENHIQGQKKRWEDPEEHERRSRLTTEQWVNPEIRENYIQGQKKRWEDPEEHKKLSERQKKKYEDPEEREKTSEIQKKSYRNDTTRSKRQAISLKEHYSKMDNPGEEIIKHHVAYDFNNPDALVVRVTKSFHGSIHHPKGISFTKRGYSLID